MIPEEEFNGDCRRRMYGGRVLSYLRIPEVRGQIITSLAQLQSQDLMHDDLFGYFLLSSHPELI